MGVLRGLVVLVAMLAARDGHAFCGFYVSGADAKLFANASQVVLMREGTRTVLSMQNDYQGPPASFAMVVPVPVVLQKENVKTLPPAIFARIDQLDAPRLVEYWERDPCAPVMDPRTGSGSPRRSNAPAKPKGGGAAPDLGVTIEAQFTVGEYEIVVLGAKDSSGLETWLNREGYKIPAGSEPFLRPYVQSGSKFFVARVDVTKVKMEGNKATLSPLRFHYDAPDLTLPIRLGLVNSAGTQDLIVHVLGKGKRYEVANYPNVTIPTNLDVAESAKGQFGAFYAALFDATLAKTPKAVVTEYAWDAGSCDPCPSPPLTDSELVTLGADVLPSVSSETELMDRELLKALGADAGSKTRPIPARKYYGLGSAFVLTRLHARYARDALGEDLVLKEAPPILGGREVRTGPDGALEPGATVMQGSSPSTFQGRYAVRHPWAGPIACAAPVRNVWGGPPNGLDNGGAKPAVGLAYAPRGSVQLASFLRTDVAALDLKASGTLPSGVGTFAVAPSPPQEDAMAADGGTPPAPEAKKSGCMGCAMVSGDDTGTLPLALASLAGALAFTRRRRRVTNER
jgi:MYXO-CTERM domain-containing protein